ncbi:hypothetical protein GCM10008929_12110 [Alkalibacterium psychrotolerans]
MNRIRIVNVMSAEKRELSPFLPDLLKEYKHIWVNASAKDLVSELVEKELPDDSISVKTLQNNNDADNSDDSIAKELSRAADKGDVLYGIIGHPLVEESAVKKVAKLAQHVELTLEGTAEKSLISLLINQHSEGFQLLPASQLNADTVQTGQHVVINRLSLNATVREAGLTLKEKYPADYECAFLIKKQKNTYRLRWLSLQQAAMFTDEELEEADVLYLPPLEIDEQIRSLSTLQYYIDEVTGSGGDVWIREQTAHSLIQYLREETEELVEAIKKEDRENWKEELGDVLVQILYQTSIAEKANQFTFEDVLEEINRKIRRRHPHVFDGVEANTPEEVDALWQKIKLEEKRLKK